MFFGSLQKSGDSCQFQSIIRIQLFQSMAVGFIKSTIVIRSSTFLLKSHQNDLESRWSLLSLVYKSRKASNHKIIKVRSEYVSVFFFCCWHFGILHCALAAIGTFETFIDDERIYESTDTMRLGCSVCYCCFIANSVLVRDNEPQLHTYFHFYTTSFEISVIYKMPVDNLVGLFM